MRKRTGRGEDAVGKRSCRCCLHNSIRMYISNKADDRFRRSNGRKFARTHIQHSPKWFRFVYVYDRITLSHSCSHATRDSSLTQMHTRSFEVRIICARTIWHLLIFILFFQNNINGISITNTQLQSIMLMHIIIIKCMLTVCLPPSIARKNTKSFLWQLISVLSVLLSLIMFTIAAITLNHTFQFTCTC